MKKTLHIALVALCSFAMAITVSVIKPVTHKAEASQQKETKTFLADMPEVVSDHAPVTDLQSSAPVDGVPTGGWDAPISTNSQPCHQFLADRHMTAPEYNVVLKEHPELFTDDDEAKKDIRSGALYIDEVAICDNIHNYQEANKLLNSEEYNTLLKGTGIEKVTGFQFAYYNTGLQLKHLYLEYCHNSVVDGHSQPAPSDSASCWDDNSVTLVNSNESGTTFVTGGLSQYGVSVGDFVRIRTNYYGAGNTKSKVYQYGYDINQNTVELPTQLPYDQYGCEDATLNLDTDTNKCLDDNGVVVADAIVVNHTDLVTDDFIVNTIKTGAKYLYLNGTTNDQLGNFKEDAKSDVTIGTMEIELVEDNNGVEVNHVHYSTSLQDLYNMVKTEHSGTASDWWNNGGQLAVSIVLIVVGVISVGAIMFGTTFEIASSVLQVVVVLTAVIFMTAGFSLGAALFFARTSPVEYKRDYKTNIKNIEISFPSRDAYDIELDGGAYIPATA